MTGLWKQYVFVQIIVVILAIISTPVHARDIEREGNKTIAEQYKERLRYPMGDFSEQAYPRDNDADYYYYGRQRKAPKVKYYPYPQDNDQAYYWYYFDQSERNNYLHPGNYSVDSQKKLSMQHQSNNNYVVARRFAMPYQSRDSFFSANH